MIGDTASARRVCGALHRLGHEIDHLVDPQEYDVTRALRTPADAVAVLLHQDDQTLRFALAVAHDAPAVPIVAAIFDATMSRQLEETLPRCQVTSPGDLAASVLAAACVDPSVVALLPEGRRAVRAVRVVDGVLRESVWDGPHHPRLRALRGWVESQLLPHDAGSMLLYTGLTGILAVLAADFAWLLHDGKPATEAFQEAAAVVATVGPAGHHGPGYAVFAGVAMLATIVFAAMFTAGLVDLLLGPRLVGLFGSRALPRSGHVIVVGIGQVGLRLCRHLQQLGVPVVGVERHPEGRYLAIARSLGIPVVVGHGEDRLLLQRLCVGRAVALAAVGSADLDNVAVAVTARGSAPDTRVVIRAGGEPAVEEPAVLRPLGATLDVTELSAAYVVARLLGVEVDLAVPSPDGVLLRGSAGVPVTIGGGGRGGCAHRGPGR